MKNEIFSKAAGWVSAARSKIVGLTTMASAALAGVCASANGVSVGGLSTGQDASNAVVAIAEVIVNIFPLVGIFFVVSGVFKLVMAYRNDNPEAQTGAAKDIVIGVVFIVFRVFVWTAVKGALGI